MKEAYINPVDPAFLAERHLCSRIIHDRDIATHGFCRPLRVQKSAHSKGPNAPHGFHLYLLVYFYVFAVGKLFSEQDGVGLGKEQEWIRYVRVLFRKFIVTDVAVLENVDTKYHE